MSNKNNGNKLVNTVDDLQITLEDIFGDNDEGNENLKVIDKWVEKQLLGNPNIKPLNKRPYPYKKHNVIEELIIKYGMSYVKELKSIMPTNVRKRINSEECGIRNADDELLIDSIAWIIWDKKLDPRSIMPGIPEYGSFWDRISESGHA